jgi:homoserine O-succinyltransferase
LLNTVSQAHINQYYQSFDDIKMQGLDALIITGAHIEDADLHILRQIYIKHPEFTTESTHIDKHVCATGRGS